MAAGKPGNPNWQKGASSPNPSGRPKMSPEQIEARDIRNRAQPKIIQFLVDTALDSKVDMRDRVACAKIVADNQPQEIELRTGDSPQWLENVSKSEAIEILELAKKASGE